MQGDFIAIEGGIGVLAYPVAEDGYGAVAVEGGMVRDVDMPKHVVLHLGVLGGVLVAEGFEALAAHQFKFFFLFFWPCHAVVVRPPGGDGVGPAGMHAGI